MNEARIAELLAPYIGASDASRLTPATLKDISTYIDLLQRWNQRINLTAIRNEEEIVTRHFGESLFAARVLFPSHVETGASPVPPKRSEAATVQVADVGSGAGFPGIPIKLWEPSLSLTLIESNHKKATFLREVTRALTLMNVNILNARAESLGESRFDVVTLRAVERFEAILPVAASLVAPGGRLALLIGEGQLKQAKSILPPQSCSTPHQIPGSSARVVAIATAQAKNQVEPRQ